MHAPQSLDSLSELNLVPQVIAVKRAYLDDGDV